ncbi:MAG: HD domain-containing phosphohydrolase [Rubrivivax sp.]|nr:HD domain-containing phosphohydrolase [Rubrivivax sp.]
MQYAELATVKHRVQPGAMLPFNVRDADGTLLLSRGHLIESRAHLDALFTRGALVDIAELLAAQDIVRAAPREQLPRLWAGCMNKLSQTLRADAGPEFAGALDDAAAPVQALIQRDPDLAIFQVLRHSAGADAAYGAQRSLQTAITSYLVGQRLGWDNEQCTLQFKVALTMNISMLELQGRLSHQAMPPTPAQRNELQTHPMRSVRILEQAGVAEPLWLQAVLQHHEQEDGNGYPSGRSDIADLASLARRADAYTSKLAARSTRDALAADQAGRQMFMQDPTHPITTALVREFGIYPPGCYVRLVSGELAIVVARGENITMPVVACLTNARGAPLAEPVRCHIDGKARAVAGVVGERQTGLHLPMERLAGLVTGP